MVLMKNRKAIPLKMNDYLVFSEDVAEARISGKPIVALESTIISHGMPYPDNIETAKTVEQIVKQQGAVPATIALSKGKIHIGLNDSQFDELAGSKKVIKASRRDLSYVLSQKSTASTTVAATMICANMANILFFVTGGIGGVHYGAAHSFDVSADLMELSKTPVNIICAGAKSILDLGKTLEYLETQGVPVIGYQTDTLPAFYSASSPLAIPMQLNTIYEIAALAISQQQLAINSGMVICNPIPKEDEIPFNIIQSMLEQCLPQTKNMVGKEITPYLLRQLSQLSDGKTLNANKALIKNNAKVGAQLAVAHQKLLVKA
jgi:pseudouridine-5'-phosphate glycosidase